MAKLLGFIDTTYKKLKAAGFDSERSWALVTKLVYRIFSDMNKVRNGVENSLELTNPADLCGKVLFATLRTIDIQEEYMRHNIADHPSISSEYVKFLAMNSGLQKVAKLEKEVEVVQKAVKKAATTTAERAAKTANTASNRASEAKEPASLPDLPVIFLPYSFFSLNVGHSQQSWFPTIFCLADQQETVSLGRRK